MSKTLIVSNDCPYPANHGGRLDILQRIKSLIEIGEVVDLIVTHKEPISNDSKQYLESICNKVIYVPRAKPFLSLFKSIIKLIPFQMASRCSLENVVLQENYDNLICESEHVHFVMKNKSLSANKKMLRIHNDESVYFKGLANDETNFLKKAYFYYESSLFKLKSKSIKKEYDLLLYISSEEYEKNKDEFNSIWLPPYMPVSLNFDNLKFSTCKNKVIFVGNLFMPNNVNGIIWYLKNVHNSLLSVNPEVELTIAGNAKNGISRDLEETIKTFPKGTVKLIKSPSNEELNELYRNHSVFINPMLNGAGVKLKNLDAMRHSFYVVSTTIGVEGTGVTNGADTIVADSPQQFLDALIGYYTTSNEDNQLVAFNAYQHIKEKFDTKLILKNII